MTNPNELLKHHVTGAIERGEAEPVVAVESKEELEELKLQNLFDSTVSALVEMAEAHRDAQDADDSEAIEDAQREIHEDPLSVRVRDGWRDPYGESPGIEEFEILLSTGGPATRIIGTVDEYGGIENFHVEVQDWFKPWTSFARMTGQQGDLIKQYYLSEFYFGE